MKKILIVIVIGLVLVSMPALNAVPIIPIMKTISSPEHISTLQPLPTADHDGTFVGGLGRIYIENGEWTYDTYAYLAGIYKYNSRYNTLYGYIYNLEEEQIGSIGAIFGNNVIVGWIKDMEDHKTPIIGFLFWNDEHFIGRIMSMFGPAPHIYGKCTPN